MVHGPDRGVAAAAGAALGTFVAEMRALSAAHDVRLAFERAREPLSRLLADPALQAHAASWPVCRRENLLLYEDPDYGFVLDGLVKAPGQATSIHDHGPVRVLYGLLSGREDIVHYRRTDGGTGEGPARIEETDRTAVTPGTLDLVTPFAIHCETAGAQGSVAVILRSERPDRVAQGRFDPAEGRWRLGAGIAQVPFPLPGPDEPR